jgi:hypothetical protein
VKCNEPGSKELVRNLYWHSPWLYIMLVFPGVVFYALVAMIVRKKAAVQVSLCERHACMRRAGISIGWGGPIAGIAAIFAVPTEMGALFLPLALIFAPLIGVLMARVVDARRIDDSHAWLSVGKAFLASYKR